MLSPRVAILLVVVVMATVMFSGESDALPDPHVNQNSNIICFAIFRNLKNFAIYYQK